MRPIVLAVALLALASCGGRAPERENLLLVTIDTIRADRVGAWGCPEARTPALDRFARRGVPFARARVPYPMTLPSHATILTGVWPYEHGARRNDTFAFDRARPTLATLLRDGGWRTGAVVATFALNAKFGLAGGFGTYDDLGGLGPGGEGRNERPADEVTDVALAWLAAGDGGETGAARAPATAGAPWFLWVHYFDAHDPYEPPAPWPAITGEDTAGRYDGEIAFVDRQLHRLLGTIELRDDAARTRVAVLGDHGEGFGAHGEEGHGYFLYDETIAVPFALDAALGGADAGGAAGAPRADAARSVDVLPTILARLGVDPPSGLPGRRLERGPVAPEPALWAETSWPALSYGATELRAVVRDDWKYVEAPRPELYDLAVDPAETDNLVTVETDVADDLRQVLAGFLAEEAARAEAAGAPDAEAVDEATRERLMGLGYLGGGSAEEEAADWSRRDPKDIIALLPLLDEGIRRCREEDWAGGIPLLEKVLASDPINPKALHWVSRDRQRRGDADGAMQVYRDALAHEPTNGGLLNTIGQLHLSRGEPAEAIGVLETATEVDPEAISPWLNLVPAYGMVGRVDDARRAVRGALAIDPENPVAKQYAKRLGVGEDR